MSQQFVRRQNAAGGETIEGLLRVRVARGQRHATAHVAICPPLERVGECYAEPCDGPPASVKVAQVLCYGVRFEIKLDEPPDEPASVVVEFAIHGAGRGRLTPRHGRVPAICEPYSLAAACRMLPIDSTTFGLGTSIRPLTRNTKLSARISSG